MLSDSISSRSKSSGGAGAVGAALFVVVTLASAFLIFLVQPMVGKKIVPWFGGAPGVWTLCLAFYQTTLFLGYAYAHLLIRFATPTAQLVIHTSMVLAAVMVLPVLPGESAVPDGVSNPALDILQILVANVALPFMVLASTGPLVQAWFARLYPERSPYALYAVSNAGSLAALLAYPFLIEPRLSLSATGFSWSIAFAVTGLALVACVALARRARLSEVVEESSGPDRTSDRLGVVRVSLWLVLAGCAVVLLMGVTNTVCLDIASVPFLWVLPLATYLLTFIVAFASERFYRPTPYLVLTVCAFLVTQGLPYSSALFDGPIVGLHSAPVQVTAYCLMLFGAGMLMHGELYRLRPSPESLTAFYLCVAGGGALGGLFVGLLAPEIFDDYYELAVGLLLAVIVFVISRAYEANAEGRDGLRSWRWRLLAPVGVVLAFVAIQPMFASHGDMLRQERGFFGVLRVAETGTGSGVRRALANGTTLHGVQFTGSKNRLTPNIHFGQASGIGLAFAQRFSSEAPIRVGIIGLGIGTLAGYGRGQDYFRYYEIDPGVVDIAQDTSLFTFLSETPAQVEIVLGDARVSMAQEQSESGSQEFDILIVDAFSSDAIPVHLLTIDAFRFYAESLAPNGLIAVHLSNQHFDLTGPVTRVAVELDLKTMTVRNASSAPHFTLQARWVLMSKKTRRIRRLSAFMKRRVREMGLPAGHISIQEPVAAALQSVPLWTDDFSDLLGALRSLPARRAATE